jgi:seryl-tRNA synthetase
MPRSAFRRALFQAAWLRPSDTDGVVATSLRFEELAGAFQRYAARYLGRPEDEILYFPPVTPRAVIERTGYTLAFPHLLGSVSGLAVNDRSHAGLLTTAEAERDWDALLSSTDLMLTPAICHPLYPLCRGVLPGGWRRFNVTGWCFRHEPSADPIRLQSFRQYEWVCLGEPQAVTGQWERWTGEATSLLANLGLEVEPVIATDPFFGRSGQILAAAQRDERLKLEFVTDIAGDGLVAIGSCNRHLDHFGAAFGIETTPGRLAHSACIGLGLERVALALLARHGLEPAHWPAQTRERLWP